MNIQTIRERLLASTMIGGAALAAAVALPVASVLVAPASAVAQDYTTGSIAGTVTDTAGSPVAGATVTVSQNNAPFNRTVTTNEQGQFRVSGAPVGTYTVTISAPGAAPFSDTNIGIGLGRVSDYEFTIGAAAGGTVDDIVVVGTRTPVINFSSSTTGLVADAQETFDRLPIARSLSGITLLAPQTTLSDPTWGNIVGISGSSVAENAYYINGMNITNPRNFLGGNTVPFEFYDQIDVKAGGYQAEFGRSTGGAIIATSRYGNDEFHGGANVYWSPDELRESAPNTYVADNERAYSDSREANVWLSGPILKDHIYAFGFYNWRESESRAYSLSGARSERVNDSPFYGGKLDLYLNPDHRFEVTYFTDDQSYNDLDYLSDDDAEADVTFNQIGGETFIYKYTGNFTDWLTLSVLYGENSYRSDSYSTAALDQTVQSNVSARTSSGESVRYGIFRGGGFTEMDSLDERQLFRADIDVYAQFMGQHHLRLGYDREQITSDVMTGYLNGGIDVYYNDRVLHRDYNLTASVDTEQSAIYLQDNWEVTDRLTLQIGLRAEKFDNKNVDGVSFAATDYEIAPRLGAVYDLFGDRKTKLSAFYGRYYLPIATNTNLRMGGAETFIDTFYRYGPTAAVGGYSVAASGGIANAIAACAADDSDTCVFSGGTQYAQQINAPGLVSDPETLASQNLEAQYQDEFMLGVDHLLESGIRLGANFVYRDLKSAMEDVDSGYFIGAYCDYAGIAEDDCGAINSGGYVLLNPGKDLIIKTDAETFPLLNGGVITIPADVIGLPEAERTYQALELTAERPFDGKWGLRGSVVLSRLKGNIEGGVKSDNGQDDTGLTQDFDEPGWMDGSYGYLPNHHAQTFKLFGTYAINDNIYLGANAIIQSPRHYGCIGAYPFDDGRAVASTVSAWYCNGELTPRGSVFSGQWQKRVDLSLAWNIEAFQLPGELQFRADVFNVFDFSGAQDYVEAGELTGGTFGAPNINPDYRRVSSYQAPRSVRFGLSWSF